MRALIRGLIIANTGLTDLIPADRWFGSGSIVDTPPRPFAEIRFGGVFTGMGSVNRRRLEIWVHDDEGDYGQIDRVIFLLKGLLDGRAHVSDSINELILAEWKGDSTDLFDDGYRTNTKSTGFDLIGTGE